MTTVAAALTLAISIAVLVAATAHAGDMPALKQSYVDQCDDEPGGKCSAAERAAVRRNIQYRWRS